MLMKLTPAVRDFINTIVLKKNFGKEDRKQNPTNWLYKKTEKKFTPNQIFDGERQNWLKIDFSPLNT